MLKELSLLVTGHVHLVLYIGMNILAGCIWRSWEMLPERVLHTLEIDVAMDLICMDIIHVSKRHWNGFAVMVMELHPQSGVEVVTTVRDMKSQEEHGLDTLICIIVDKVDERMDMASHAWSCLRRAVWPTQDAGESPHHGDMRGMCS